MPLDTKGQLGYLTVEIAFILAFLVWMVLAEQSALQVCSLTELQPTNDFDLTHWWIFPDKFRPHYVTLLPPTAPLMAGRN